MSVRNAILAASKNLPMRAAFAYNTNVDAVGFVNTWDIPSVLPAELRCLPDCMARGTEKEVYVGRSTLDFLMNDLGLKATASGVAHLTFQQESGKPAGFLRAPIRSRIRLLSLLRHQGRSFIPNPMKRLGKKLELRIGGQAGNMALCAARLGVVSLVHSASKAREQMTLLNRPNVLVAGKVGFVKPAKVRPGGSPVCSRGP